MRRRSRARALALRSRIVLESAEGHSIAEVSRRPGIAPETVRAWRRRFLDRGLEGMHDDAVRRRRLCGVDEMKIRGATVPPVA
ncbi:helix-turn-helix domain-containing protein [Streptomyces sp. NPDC057575]|uniref:helix-turn-helix domain-containing protein n=1 Tax=unclassified Streptomyces TaxID=2593676 RepID=UPI0036B296A5